MITGEDIYALEQEKAFDNVKGDINQALRNVQSAIHYLYETFEYDSDMLDDTVDQLMLIADNLQGMLEE